MTPVFIVLIPITLIFIVVIAFVFWQALHSGQFDDLDKVSEDILRNKD